MSFIRHRSTRLMLAIAAVLALGGIALPASAATARPGATCDTTPVFFGLHGMGEGPPVSSKHQFSPEIASFDTDQNAISGAVLNAPVPYPVVDVKQWWTLFVPGIAAVQLGEHKLQTEINDYTTGCRPRQDRIALLGYSMGAWVINLWIMEHPRELNMIKAVVLYGDPCWVNGKDKGLVRRYGSGAGCMPAADYPYPAPRSIVPFKVQSWTMPNDPVSGAGWGGKKGNAQIKTARKCAPGATPHCTHLDYSGSTEIYQGAQFVVSRLVG